MLSERYQTVALLVGKRVDIGILNYPHAAANALAVEKRLAKYGRCSDICIWALDTAWVHSNGKYGQGMQCL